MNKTIAIVFGLAASTLLITGAQASSDYCTSKPRSAWMSTDAAAAQISSQGYRIYRTEVSGTCYEVKVRRNGRRVELKLDPASGRIVRREHEGRRYAERDDDRREYGRRGHERREHSGRRQHERREHSRRGYERRERD
jgi:hypothetical protein